MSSLGKGTRTEREIRELEEELAATRAERDDLRLAEIRWRNLMDHSPFGVVIYRPDGSVRAANATMKRTFALSDAEYDAVTSSYNILEDPQLVAKGLAEPVRKAFAGEASVLSRVDYEVGTSIEGKSVRRWFEGVVFPIHDLDGALREVVSIQTDVSALMETQEELKDERDRAQSYLDVAGVLLVTIDVDEKVTLINEQGCRLLGYPSQEVLGENWFDRFLPGTERERTRDAFRRLMKGELPAVEYFENPILTRDGESKTIAWHNAVLRDEAGRIVGALSSGEDITERKQAEKALRESEERFRRTFENSAIGMALGGSDGRLFRVNRAFCDMLGYTEKEFLSRSPEQLTHPEDRDMTRGVVHGILRGEIEGDTLRVEKRYLHKEGHDVWAAVGVTAVRDGRGKPLHSVVQALNITERRHAEEALRESEERFREMAENIQEAFWLFDRVARRVIYASPAYETIWGRPLRELYADYGEWRNSVHPDDRAQAETYLAVTAETGGGAPREYRIVRPDGEVRWISDCAFAIRNESGQVVRIAGVAADITDRKAEEEERQRLQTKIQHAQKLESLGVLAGGIAHDFNNLLMAILGNADLALLKLAPESPGREFVETIEKAAERASELTNQMLAYSGKGRFVVEPIQLNRLVEEMAHLLEMVISKKARIQFHFDTNLPSVQADASQVRQVAMNLITNASEALGEETGTIRLSTGTVDADRAYLDDGFPGDELADGTYVYLEVSDTGCGMDEETRRKIFDPFFTTKFTGRGLGLAAVLGIVRGHGGFVRVYSEPQRGSTFKVLLPASEAAVEKRDRPEPEAARRDLEGVTILVVDDDPDVLIVAKKMLEQEGFRTLTAADGREGVEVFRARQSEIALVVLDMTMPQMDGEEAFRELRRIRADVRVILSSGYNEQEATNRFAGKGLAGFIQKPYRTAKLLNQIHAALGAS